MSKRSTFKTSLMAAALAFSAFSLNANATLTSYTANGKDLVYSSVSNVTWTKDANLLGTWFNTQGFSTVVNNMLSVTSKIGTYTLTSNDFSSNGQTSWFGALAFINYLNNINYAGSNQWRLPSAINTSVGTNTPTNGTAAGDELPELFYSELGGTAFNAIPNTASFDNEQSFAYWSGTESASDADTAWYFNTNVGYQTFDYKFRNFYAWAVSTGQISAVPEPEYAAMLLLGLGLVGVATRRKQA